MTLALASLALASLLAAVSAARSSEVAAGVTVAGVSGIVVLVAALAVGSRALVAPAVGVLALAAVGANSSSFALVPVESAMLVAVALLAWWSVDERPAYAGEPRVDAGRAATSASLVVAAAGLSILVISMGSVASAGLVAPAVGEVGLASIAAVLWSVAALRRYEAEHRS